MTTEHEFLIKIGKYKGLPVYFHGKVDELYEGGMMGEHKTFTRPPDMSLLAMNTQVCLYAKAHELEFGDKLKTVLWDYVKSTPAERPIWLEKSERFSTAQSSKITPFSWIRAHEERGIEDGNKTAAFYEPNIANFFFRVRMDIHPEMVDSIWDDFKKTTRELITQEDSTVKNVTRDCSWCNFRPICYAEFTGADVDYVIKTDFVQRVTVEEDVGGE